METEKISGRCLGKAGCEIWKDIKGYEGIYQISSWGRVRSLDHVFYQKHYSGIMAKHEIKGKIMKLHKRLNGYMCIGLTNKEGKNKTYSIHRLVGIHFLEKPEGKDCINHLDSNPSNNHVSNLEWCTQSENIFYAYRYGNMIPPHQRKVGQYDLNGNLIKVWISQTEAARQLGIHQSNIYKVCSGKRETAGGFKWQYTE